MAAAGCGSHVARIIRSTGGVVSAAQTLMEVEWNRTLNDVSTARVLIAPEGNCCEELSGIRTWRHKLAIWRDGEQVWDGPIITVKWTLGNVEIFAGDITAYLGRRVPHKTMSFTGSDLTDIASWLIEDGFAPDDPGHTVQVVAPSKVKGDRSYTVDTGQTGDHLKDLSDTGLDYTAVGSTIILLPDNHTASVGSLTDADLPSGLAVTEDGVELATRWIVHGDQTNAAIKGTAGGTDAYYGLLERTVDETSILDNLSATSAAKGRLAANLPVPVFLDSQDVTLSPEAPVNVAKLVPGWCLDISTTQTCRTVHQRMKISAVKVTEDGQGESVQISLSQTGAATAA